MCRELRNKTYSRGTSCCDDSRPKHVAGRCGTDRVVGPFGFGPFGFVWFRFGVVQFVFEYLGLVIRTNLCFGLMVQKAPTTEDTISIAPLIQDILMSTSRKMNVWLVQVLGQTHAHLS